MTEKKSTNPPVQEVFDDVNLGAVVLFLFLLQLIQEMMNRQFYCSC
jgi:hypothetical protein